MHSTRVKPAFYLVLLVLFFLIASCRQRITRGIIKTSPTTVGPEWLSISLSEPVIAKWDVQVIFVNIGSKLQCSVDQVGIKLDDGSTIVPEVELVSRTGQEQPFRLSGCINAVQLLFENDQIARGSSFSELRIRSPKPLVCSRIKWMSYMPEDNKFTRCSRLPC